MANYNNFGDYMFSLLFTPLRSAKKSFNQFYIFFKVIGKIFDDCKTDIFKVRTESMVISASETMLNEHGKDRKMIRLKNEDAETYRTRLCMKAILSKNEGTRPGVLLAVKSLGYTNASVMPYRVIDPDRWAEFLVKINVDLDVDTMEYSTLRKEVRDIKEASAKDNYEFTMYSSIQNVDEVTILTLTNPMDVNWWSQKQTLDGNISLNGSNDLDTELINYKVVVNGSVVN